MEYLPQISKQTTEARAQQFYRLNDEQAMDMLEKWKTSLFMINPGLAFFIHTLIGGLFDPESIDKLNRSSSTPEEFCMRVHFGTLIIVYIMLDMINAQAESDKMREQYE